MSDFENRGERGGRGGSKDKKDDKGGRRTFFRRQLGACREFAFCAGAFFLEERLRVWGYQNRRVPSGCVLGGSGFSAFARHVVSGAWLEDHEDEIRHVAHQQHDRNTDGKRQMAED